MEQKYPITFSLPAGEYIIGDACYQSGDDPRADMAFYAAANENSGGHEEAYFDGEVEAHGAKGIFLSTAYGDGLYNLNNGHGDAIASLGVDAGNLSILPLAWQGKDGWLDKFREENKYVRLGQKITLPDCQVIVWKRGVWDIVAGDKILARMDTDMDDEKGDDELTPEQEAHFIETGELPSGEVIC